MTEMKKFVLRMPVSLVSALDKIREQEGGFSRNRFILLILQDYVSEYLSFSSEESLPACIICGIGKIPNPLSPLDSGSYGAPDDRYDRGCSWVFPGLCSKCAGKLGGGIAIAQRLRLHPDAGRGRIVDENGKNVELPPELHEVARKHAEWDGKSSHPYGCVGPDPDGECFDELDEQLGKEQREKLFEKFISSEGKD
jgi:hypothetical protein